MQDDLRSGARVPDPDPAPTYTGPRQNHESRNPMPTLTDEMKTFIVMGLARFDTPSAVAEAVKSTFGVEITRQHVHLYDPACAQRPASRWCELHAATRRAFLAEIAGIGVSHKAVRLRLLERMTHQAIENRYPHVAAALLEQAAKECGGIYDRTRRPRDAAPGAED
jgi:hypothetical protein